MAMPNLIKFCFYRFIRFLLNQLLAGSSQKGAGFFFGINFVWEDYIVAILYVLSLELFSLAGVPFRINGC